VVSVKFVLPFESYLPAFAKTWEVYHTVTLKSNSLDSTMTVVNTSSATEPFKFHCFFHDWLKVQDVEKVSVGGLAEGTEYLEEVKGDNGSYDTGSGIDRVWKGGNLDLNKEMAL
jgi:D-hexose-6-phosphate mutarotase